MANTANTVPDIESLFDNDRCPSGVAVLPLVLYFPFGILLAIIRVFVGVQTFIVACILPKMSSLRGLILRTMCGVCGVWVTQEGAENRDVNAKILVSNYTTTLDHLALDLVLPNVMPCVWDLPASLMWVLGYTDMGAKQGRDTLIQNAQKHCQTSNLPLLAFPEGASTNGRMGLLKFSLWPFSVEHPVQPIIIHVNRPLIARLAPSVLGGRWWIDIFWFLFVPYTYFHVKILPASKRDEDETVEEFTRRLQAVMAAALGVTATPHTSADKVEYAKRKFFILPQSNSSAGGGSGSGAGAPMDAVQLMCYQVKEVLPNVPLAVIRNDLALTKDVDLTITNILEGRVQFLPEEPSVDSSPPSVPTQHTASSISRSTMGESSPKSFSKSSKDRHLSLEERKKLLIETARQRYMEKHGLL